jgi:hypothetical protein
MIYLDVLLKSCYPAGSFNQVMSDPDPGGPAAAAKIQIIVNQLYKKMVCKIQRTAQFLDPKTQLLKYCSIIN